MLKKLASLQHEIWAHSMRYLFSVSIQNDDGSVTIVAEKVVRWKRQMETPYAQLTEREQASDIDQAQKVMSVLEE